MNLTITESYIRECLKKARYFEFCANVDPAQAVLNPIMESLAEGQNPGILNVELMCELFLVYGTVISYQGLTKKEQYLQETAMDFLTEARKFAFETGKRDLISECEKQNGLCYWRLGQHDNALVYFDTVLENYSPEEQETNTVCLATQIYLMGIYFDLQNIKAAKKLLDKIKPFIEAANDKWLQVKFYTEAAGIHLKLADFASAIPFLKKATKLSEITKNYAALANGLNNLALVYLTTEDAGKARNYIEKAIKVFSSLEQQFTLGMALETKAQILISINDFKAAREAVDESISILERSENYVALAESMWTRIVIFAKSGEMSAVVINFNRLLDVIKNRLSEETVNSYVEKFTHLVYIESGSNYYEKMENYRKYLLDNALDENASSEDGASVMGAARVLGISHQNASLLLKKYPDLCDKYAVKIRTRVTDSFRRKRNEAKTASD